MQYGRYGYRRIRRMLVDEGWRVNVIHNTQTGVRLRGWAAFQELLPLIENRLANKTWPKVDPAVGMPASHPAFAVPPWAVGFTCKALPPG